MKFDLAGWCKGCNRNTLLARMKHYFIREDDTPYDRTYYKCGWCGFENIELREVKEDYPDVRSLIMRGHSPLQNYYRDYVEP